MALITPLLLSFSESLPFHIPLFFLDKEKPKEWRKVYYLSIVWPSKNFWQTPNFSTKRSHSNGMLHDDLPELIGSDVTADAHTLPQAPQSQRLNKPEAHRPNFCSSEVLHLVLLFPQGPEVAPWACDKAFECLRGRSSSTGLGRGHTGSKHKGTTLWVAYLYTGVTETIGMRFGETT